MSKGNTAKKGDKVFIWVGPLDKVGRYGKVETMMTNGAIIKLSETQFTPVQFEHFVVVSEKEYEKGNKKEILL